MLHRWEYQIIKYKKLINYNYFNLRIFSFDLFIYEGWKCILNMVQWKMLEYLSYHMNIILKFALFELLRIWKAYITCTQNL